MTILNEAYRRIQSLTREQCAEWAANPKKNPLTGRAIEIGKPTYKSIADRCKEAFNIEPAAEIRNRSPLPYTYEGYNVPRTTKKWMNSYIRDVGFRIYEACRRFGFLSETFVELAREYVTIVSLLERHELLVERDTPLDFRAKAYIKTLLDAPDGIRKWGGNARTVHDLKQYLNADIQALLTGLPRQHLTIARDLEMIQFAQMVNKYGPVSETQVREEEELIEMLIAAEALEQDIVLMRAPAGVEGEGEGADAYALPESRERSLPSSLSRRRVKQKKPKKNAADPDEFYPWSATEEGAPTDRSQFRSHAKLSAVSPGPAGVSPLAALATPKKRTALLAELRAACTVMKDMISMTRFDRMNKKTLQLIVRLGPEGSQQRCYYVKNLYQLWAAATRSRAPLKDPLTRDAVTNAEKDEIMRKIRAIRPNAPDPRAHRLAVDPKLTFNITPVVRDGIGFYKLDVTRPVGRMTYVVNDLGYVPSQLELSDVGGDANLTSDAVIASLRALFDAGALLHSHVPPYGGCRLHLRKPIRYWTEVASRDAFAKGVNLRRWRLLASEVYGAL